MVQELKQLSEVRAVPLLQNWQREEMVTRKLRFLNSGTGNRQGTVQHTLLIPENEKQERGRNSLARTASPNTTFSCTSKHQKRAGGILVQFLGEIGMQTESVTENSFRTHSHQRPRDQKQ